MRSPVKKRFFGWIRCIDGTAGASSPLTHNVLLGVEVFFAGRSCQAGSGVRSSPRDCVAPVCREGGVTGEGELDSSKGVCLVFSVSQASNIVAPRWESEVRLKVKFGCMVLRDTSLVVVPWVGLWFHFGFGFCFGAQLAWGLHEGKGSFFAGKGYYLVPLQCSFCPSRVCDLVFL